MAKGKLKGKRATKISIIKEEKTPVSNQLTDKLMKDGEKGLSAGEKDLGKTAIPNREATLAERLEVDRSKTEKIQDLQRFGDTVRRLELSEPKEDINKMLHQKWADFDPSKLRKAGAKLDFIEPRNLEGVKFHGLELKYWNPRSLSSLASNLGQPIMPDIETTEKTKVQYARVLIDVEIQDLLPLEVVFEDELGIIQHQSVFYEWRPTQCTHCKGYGHGVEACRKKLENREALPKRTEVKERILSGKEWRQVQKGKAVVVEEEDQSQ
ncbi:OLC1v1036980C1 [Oldenlandia corymbosa var. corymbosa]|uniref:OLC1v1036980C1 n=1 Tax=Oldenlandia corymbosa var. corymbosa TaxID=529605 RepID=A0AAV1CX88_OLDCO|nr:OLC1v1036980C1 [Oldenlandia corymbosa var. corymbosa]